MMMMMMMNTVSHHDLFFTIYFRSKSNWMLIAKTALDVVADIVVWFCFVACSLISPLHLLRIERRRRWWWGGGTRRRGCSSSAVGRRRVSLVDLRRELLGPPSIVTWHTDKHRYYFSDSVIDVKKLILKEENVKNVKRNKN